MQTPCKHLANTLQTPCKHFANTLQTLCKHLANTLQTPCRHVANRLQTLWNVFILFFTDRLLFLQPGDSQRSCQSRGWPAPKDTNGGLMVIPVWTVGGWHGPNQSRSPTAQLIHSNAPPTPWSVCWDPTVQFQKNGMSTLACCVFGLKRSTHALHACRFNSRHGGASVQPDLMALGGRTSFWPASIRNERCANSKN